MTLTCPICNCFLSSSIEYICGNPTVIYKCDCGYDSSKVQLVASNHTDSIKPELWTIRNNIIGEVTDNE